MPIIYTWLCSISCLSQTEAHISLLLVYIVIIIIIIIFIIVAIITAALCETRNVIILDEAYIWDVVYRCCFAAAAAAAAADAAVIVVSAKERNVEVMERHFTEQQMKTQPHGYHEITILFELYTIYT